MYPGDHSKSVYRFSGELPESSTADRRENSIDSDTGVLSIAIFTPSQSFLPSPGRDRMMSPPEFVMDEALSTPQGRDHAPIAHWVGWFMLGAGISQLVPLVAGMRLLEVSAKVSSIFFALAGPTFILLTGGAVGLILRQPWAYYCAYLAYIFLGFRLGRLVEIPFQDRVFRMSLAAEDVYLVLNLLVIVLLAWEHWNRLWDTLPRRRNIERVAMLVLVLIGLATSGYARSLISKGTGQVASASQLPAVGPSVGSLETTSPFYFQYRFDRRQGSLMFLGSSTATESGVRQFADAHGLKEMADPAAHRKFLPLARTWGVDPQKIPRAFASEDLYFVGRLTNAPKMTVQLVQRRSDGRFTAQFFGALPSASGSN